MTHDDLSWTPQANSTQLALKSVRWNCLWVASVGALCTGSRHSLSAVHVSNSYFNDIYIYLVPPPAWNLVWCVGPVFFICNIICMVHHWGGRKRQRSGRTWRSRWQFWLAPGKGIFTIAAGHVEAHMPLEGLDGGVDCRLGRRKGTAD